MTKGALLVRGTGGLGVSSRLRPGMPGSFHRREISTGKTSRWLEFQPADLTGVTEFGGAGITPDGRSYAYGYERV